MGNTTQFVISTPTEICETLGQRVRARRLAHNISLDTLAQRSGVSELTIRKFEKTGRCQLITLISILSALNAVHELQAVLEVPSRSIEVMRAAAADRRHAYSRSTPRSD